MTSNHPSQAQDRLVRLLTACSLAEDPNAASLSQASLVSLQGRLLSNVDAIELQGFVPDKTR